MIYVCSGITNTLEEIRKYQCRLGQCEFLNGSTFTKGLIAGNHCYNQIFCKGITTILMYLVIEIRHNILLHYYGNYNEVKNINYTLEIDIF